MVVCLFIRPIVPGSAHAAWSWHKRSQDKSKLTLIDALTVKSLRASFFTKVNFSVASSSGLFLARVLDINSRFHIVHLLGQ